MSPFPLDTLKEIVTEIYFRRYFGESSSTTMLMKLNCLDLNIHNNNVEVIHSTLVPYEIKTPK